MMRAGIRFFRLCYGEIGHMFPRFTAYAERGHTYMSSIQRDREDIYVRIVCNRIMVCVAMPVFLLHHQVK